MRGGDGRVVLVKRMYELREVLVGVISPIYREMVFAQVPGNVPIPRVGELVTLFIHSKSKRLTANRMEAVT